MYRDEELNVHEECEDPRKSKYFTPYITSSCYEMQLPTIEESYVTTRHCPICGNFTDFREDTNFYLGFNLDEFDFEDDSNPYFEPDYDQYYNPYYRYYYKPYPTYGPW